MIAVQIRQVDHTNDLDRKIMIRPDLHIKHPFDRHFGFNIYFPIFVIEIEGQNEEWRRMKRAGGREEGEMEVTI